MMIMMMMSCYKRII